MPTHGRNETMPKQITLISFDLDNTLWPTRKVIGRAERSLRHWLEQHHGAAAATGLSTNNFWQLRQQVAEAQPHLRHQPTLLRQAVLREGFLASGYSASAAQEAALLAFDAFIAARNHITFFPQAIDNLRTLAQQYRLVAITNGNANLERVGIMPFVTAQYTAEQVGHAKPAAEIYEHMLAEQHISPEHCLHVGDHPVEDIEAARQCGMQTLWANLTQAQWPAEIAPPERTVTTLGAIPHQLKQN